MKKYKWPVSDITVDEFDAVMSKASEDGKMSVLERDIWNKAIEAAAGNLETHYPEHKWVNAYCASIRMLKIGKISNIEFLIFIGLRERRFNYSTMTITGRRGACRR